MSTYLPNQSCARFNFLILLVSVPNSFSFSYLAFLDNLWYQSLNINSQLINQIYVLFFSFSIPFTSTTQYNYNVFHSFTPELQFHDSFHPHIVEEPFRGGGRDTNLTEGKEEKTFYKQYQPLGSNDNFQSLSF